MELESLASPFAAAAEGPTGQRNTLALPSDCVIGVSRAQSGEGSRARGNGDGRPASGAFAKTRMLSSMPGPPADRAVNPRLLACDPTSDSLDWHVVSLVHRRFCTVPRPAACDPRRLRPHIRPRSAIVHPQGLARLSPPAAGGVVQRGACRQRARDKPSIAPACPRPLTHAGRGLARQWVPDVRSRGPGAALGVRVRCVVGSSIADCGPTRMVATCAFSRAAFLALPDCICGLGNCKRSCSPASRPRAGVRESRASHPRPAPCILGNGCRSPRQGSGARRSNAQQPCSSNGRVRPRPYTPMPRLSALVGVPQPRRGGLSRPRACSHAAAGPPGGPPPRELSLHHFC